MTSKPYCHFCARDNPVGSKFCNQCGSPLDLKPCPHCEAMNHVNVDRCYQCGASFHIDRTLEVAEVGAAANRAMASARPSAPAAATVDTIPGAFLGRPVRSSPDAGRQRAAWPADMQERDPARIELPQPVVAQTAVAPGDGAAIDPRRVQEGRRDPSLPKRAAYGAVAGVVLCAVAAGAYYAHSSGMLSRVVSATQSARSSGAAESSDTRLAAPATAQPSGQAHATLDGQQAVSQQATPQQAAPQQAAPQQATPQQATPQQATPQQAISQQAISQHAAPQQTRAPAVAAAPATAPTTATTSTPATASTSPNMAPPENAAAAARAPTTASVPASAPASAAVPASASTASSVASSAVSLSTPRSESAPQRAARASDATQTDAHASPEAPTRGTRRGGARQYVDRDALATQRLIERDLAGFLPPTHTPDSAPPRRP